MASPIVAMWAANETLMSRASTGRLVLIGENISRGDIITNEEVLVPVLKHLGLRTTVHQILEHVELFLAYARPKGKADIPRVST